MGNKKILIATGGTGGHIYPALVTAEELRRRGWSVYFVGALGPAVKKITESGFDCVNIKVKGFVSKGPLQILLAAGYLLYSIGICFGVILRFRPTVVLGFGGYSSFPAVFASACLGGKTIIHEQNVCPGLANKILSRLARKVALSVKAGKCAFGSARTVWTGCPMREMSVARPRARILKEFGLEEGRKTILVFGGSQGSRGINNAVAACFEQIDQKTPWQVIHIAGKGAAEELKGRYGRAGFPAYVKEYMENIQDAYALANMVIARSGAGTVTELGLQGIASILVPYPYANSHQEANARVLEDYSAGVIIQEKDLNPSLLEDKIFLVLEQALPRAMLRLKMTEDFVSNAAQRLCDEVESL